jgi:hypothetical protein
VGTGVDPESVSLDGVDDEDDPKAAIIKILLGGAETNENYAGVLAIGAPINAGCVHCRKTTNPGTETPISTFLVDGPVWIEVPDGEPVSRCLIGACPLGAGQMVHMTCCPTLKYSCTAVAAASFFLVDTD